MAHNSGSNRAYPVAKDRCRKSNSGIYKWDLSMTHTPLEALMNKAYELQCGLINGSPPDDTSTPSFIAEDENGETYFYATPFHNEASKAAIISVLRREFQRNKVVRYVLVTEAWVSRRKKDDLRLDERPSEDPNRENVVMVAGVDKDGTILSKNARIVIADDNKRHVDPFGSEDDCTSVGGRMTTLLDDECC